MKITNGQNVILQEDKEFGKKSVSPQDFNNLLTNELEQSPAQGLTSFSSASSASPLPKVHSVNTENMISLGGAVIALGMHEVALQVDSLFSDMDTYAAQLNAPDASGLKKTFALLEQMSSKITRLRTDYPDMVMVDPALASLVNELDVLTTTETFKLNRGDYL